MSLCNFEWNGGETSNLNIKNILNSRFILTAGHCVHYCREGLLPNCSHPIPFSELTFKVVLGEYDVNSKHKERTIQRYHATNVLIHPDFTNIFRLRDNGFLESEPRHDVALLKLDRHVRNMILKEYSYSPLYPGETLPHYWVHLPAPLLHVPLPRHPGHSDRMGQAWCP